MKRRRRELKAETLRTQMKEKEKKSSPQNERRRAEIAEA